MQQQFVKSLDLQLTLCPHRGGLGEVVPTQVLNLFPDIDARRHLPPDPIPDPTVGEDGVIFVDWIGISSPIASPFAWILQIGLSQSGFDWGAFVSSPRGRLLVERVHTGDPGDMTPEECRMLLLALARQERFVDDAIDGAMRSGFISVVLRRAEVLLGG
jgi:hypothetical protein